MKRWLFGLIMALAPTTALAETPSPAATSTVTPPLSPEDMELAQYLTLLENLELLADWDMLELWPVLQEEDDE